MGPRYTGRALEILARWGYAARGIVYCVVGVFAFLAAFGQGGGVRGSTGALQTLLHQPLGEALVITTAIGMLGFTIWRLIQAFWDPDRDGTSWKALLERATYLGSAVIYAGLAATAFNIAFGSGGSASDDRAAQDWTAWLMSQPFGRWITGAVGIGVAAAGVVFIFQAWKARVTQHLRAEEARSTWILILGRVGYAASGVVFLIVGALLLAAALHSNAAEVRGLGGALVTLQAQPYGSTLLAIVAAGLFAFGVFGVVEGIYRRIDAPDVHDAKEMVSRAAERLT